jgi:methanogenic corrinoid protein MtbC1
MQDMEDFKSLYEAFLNGDAKFAKATTGTALAAGVEPLKLVQEYMMPAMAEVGRRFESNEYFVPELLIAARAMKAALELIRPLLIASGAQAVARVALGTVKGDCTTSAKISSQPCSKAAAAKSLIWASTCRRNNSSLP